MFKPDEYVGDAENADPIVQAISMLQTAQGAESEEKVMAVSAVIDMLTKLLNGPTEAESTMATMPVGQGAKRPGYMGSEIGQNPGSLEAPEESNGNGVPMVVKELPKAPANAGNNKRLSAEPETQSYGGKITG